MECNYRDVAVVTEFSNNFTKITLNVFHYWSSPAKFLKIEFQLHTDNRNELIMVSNFKALKILLLAAIVWILSGL
jgi:hypothetical protein